MMKLQKNPNDWSCLPTSFAMVLDIPVQEFIEKIGHDGSDTPYENKPDQVAGFHEQECIEVAQKLGYACTPIEIVPQMMPSLNGPVRPVWFSQDILSADSEDWNWQRFEKHLHESRGVLTGILYNKIGHAAAWNDLNKRVYDPRGSAVFIKDAIHLGFQFHTFWKVQKYE